MLTVFHELAEAGADLPEIILDSRDASHEIAHFPLKRDMGAMRKRDRTGSE
jgi:hypothetical protein